MALDEYRRKRKFQQTPEPTGGAAAAPTGSRFVIQMHHASRLHFDFRLEMEGVLKSWAVPKGPSLDPSQKRLAMMTEDHPLEYMTFEGIIPAGNYGGGTVMVWDIGTFEPMYNRDGLEMLKAGDLKFQLHGQKLNGEFALVRMKARRPGSRGNEWLMLKKKDAYADLTWTVEQADRSALTGRSMMEIAADRGSEMWGKEKAPRAARQAAERTIAKFGAELNLASLPGAKSSAMPTKIEAMLAKLASSPPQGADWLQEIKWDGIRAIVYVNDGKLRLVSRNENDITKHYPDLGGIAGQVRARQAILDGEIVCLEASGRPSFEMLQQRMNLRTPDPRKVADLPVIFYAFDLLYVDGYDLRQTPLERRKELLRALLRPAESQDDRARFSDHHIGDGNMLLELAAKQGLEGIMCKRRLSTYDGRRSGDWLKVKIEQHQECIVLGWTAPSGSRKHFGSLALGVYRDKKLVFAGNAGSGFDDKTQQQVFQALEALPEVPMPFKTVPEGNATTTWVKPELLAEIKFAEWTNEGRMRAPVFLSLKKAWKPLFMKRSGEQAVDVDGQRMLIKNLDKVYFPRDGYTKSDVIEYYYRIAPTFLPHMAGKPVVMKRYPDGIEKPFFFQKDAGVAMPSWIRTVALETGEGTGEKGKGTTRFVMCDNRATLVYLAQLGCIDHNLWQSSEGTLVSPDFILFDLDPGERATMGTLVETVQLLHEVFRELKLDAYPKTSGVAGMHIYVPLEPVYTYEQARTLCEVICHVVERRAPKLMTHERSLGKRPQERIYLDYMQIGQGKTVPPPYSLRPQPGATLSTPLEWAEVRAGLDPRAFTIETIWRRLEEKGDLFEGALNRRQRLEPALERLDSLASKT